MQIDRYKIHDIELVIDRLEITKDIRARLYQSLQTAMKQGKGTIMVQEADLSEKKKATKASKPSVSKVRFFSRSLMSPSSGISYDEPAPNSFSFNSPYGACSKCNGLGEVSEIDIKKLFLQKIIIYGIKMRDSWVA